MDARLTALSRAAFHRGRASRRYDAFKGVAPPLSGELRTLAGCVWHTVRRRCGNGIVLTALTAGRLAELLDPAPGADPGRHARLRLRAAPGRCRGPPRSSARRATPAPRCRRSRSALALAREARRAPRRRVLVLGVARPENARTVAAARRELARSRHDVAVHLDPPRGRTRASGATSTPRSRCIPPHGFDWLLIVDDDVRLPRGFLDAFLLCAERFGFRLAQPAHAFASHAAWDVTRRRPGLLARTGRFVEIGPVTAIHRDAFGALLPFPDLAMGWGLDARWSALAAERGWPVGIVDATPIRHLRPVAGDYPRDAAIAEAEAFLDGRAYVTREQAAEVLAEHRRLLMRVAIVAEYYPRAADPVLGVWAHRQALAARDAGADVRVLVLHRPVPSPRGAAQPRRRGAGRAAAPAAARRARRDRGPLRAVRRSRRGRAATAAGARGRRRRWRSRCAGCGASSPSTSSTPTTPRPAGDAVRRARPRRADGDLGPRRRRAVGRAALAAATWRCAARCAPRGSCWPTRRAIAERARELGARDVRVVHLGHRPPRRRRRPATGS